MSNNLSTLVLTAVDTGDDLTCRWSELVVIARCWGPAGGSEGGEVGSGRWGGGGGHLGWAGAGIRTGLLSLISSGSSGKLTKLLISVVAVEMEVEQVIFVHLLRHIVGRKESLVLLNQTADLIVELPDKCRSLY